MAVAPKTEAEQLQYWKRAFTRMGVQIIMEADTGTLLMFGHRVQGLAQVELLRKVSKGLHSYAETLEEEVKKQAITTEVKEEAAASFG
jgi:ornithine cyclodeaminase/alanine dehydrogenase-like protein (mu-crystallin family)